VNEDVCVAVLGGVDVCVNVNVGVGVFVDVGAAVGVCVEVGVLVNVFVGACVAVGVGMDPPIKLREAATSSKAISYVSAGVFSPSCKTPMGFVPKGSIRLNALTRLLLYQTSI
jgi:hypothetical protein